MKTAILACSFAAALALPTGAAAATMNGETVTINYIFGADGNATFDAGGNFVVGPGVETTQFSALSVDVGDTSVAIENISGDNATFFGSAAFNGFRILDTFDTISRSFTDFAISSSTFDNVGISATENALFVNFLDGPSVASLLGDRVVIEFSSPEVIPLPAGVVLLISGLAGMTVLKRRRTGTA